MKNKLYILLKDAIKFKNKLYDAFFEKPKIVYIATQATEPTNRKNPIIMNSIEWIR